MLSEGYEKIDMVNQWSFAVDIAENEGTTE